MVCRFVHGVSLMRILAPLWALGGICLLLGSAIYRLTPRALEAFEGGLTPWQWVVLVVWTLFMGVGEGYRGFQKKFSPRTAARIRYLRDHPTLLRTLFAPVVGMGYVHATRKVRITAISLTLGIIVLVLLVSRCPQPWRGIIDFGVVFGLTWGTISLLIHTWQALTRPEFPHSPEVPDSRIQSSN